MEQDCCRICLSKTQTLERQDLFLEEGSNLSVLGRLYEEVLNIPLAEEKITLKFICNSCGLQLKLFKQLKNKALETHLLLTEILAVTRCNDDNIVDNKENKQFQTNVLIGEADTLESNQINSEFVVENAENTSIAEYDDYQDSEGLESKTTKNDITEIECDIVEHDVDDEDNIISNYPDEYTLDRNDHEIESNILEQIEEQEDEEYASVGEYYKIEDTTDDDEYEVCYLDDDIVSENAKEEIDQEEYNEECIVEEEDINEIKPICNGKDIFICPHCDESFVLKSHLKNHEKKMHSTSTKMQCHICNKALFSSETYQAHMNVHDGLPAYQCNICQKPFNQKVHYNYHMMNHKNERNIICIVCQKGFISNGDLKTHMRCHTDERRYKCDICDKRFRAHTHMVNHRYSHFEKQFECPVCFQKYMSPNTLRTHYKDVHGSEVRFECEFCEKRFKRKHHLQAHYRTHGKAVGSIKA